MQYHLRLRPSQIANPTINFVLTGTGFALQFQHIILVFLTGQQGVLTSDLLCLSQVAVHFYRITVTWRQVDTPSLASAPNFQFHISDVESD